MIDPTERPDRHPSTRGSARSSWRRVVATVGVGLGVLALVGSVGAHAADDGDDEPTPPVTAPRVLATTVDGPITPVISDHVADGLGRALAGGYDAYLIRLDTPGGLDTSMRRIVQDIYASEVPVIVHVAPPGARGASAGAVITFSAHVAAMAPGTTIGAATPVAGGGGDDLDAKIINDAVAYVESIAELRGRDREFLVDTVRDGRSASAAEALEVGAIDAIASSTAELLDAVDGTVVVVGVTDREITMSTAGAVVDDHDMGVFRSIQQLLADPNIAFLLLSIGTLGLIYELASPGLGVGAVLGLTFVVLGLFGLSVLSVNLVGLVFLLLAAALFVAEVFAPGIGLAAAGGAFSLVLSGIFLFDDSPGMEVSLAVVLPVAIVVGVFVVVAGRVAMRARRAPSTTTGSGLFVGRRAVVRSPHGRPQVFIEGAWWGVRPHDPSPDPAAPSEPSVAGGSTEAALPAVLVDGVEVTVVDVDGLTLLVEPVGVAGPPSAAPLGPPTVVVEPNQTLDAPANPPVATQGDGQPGGTP